MLATVVITSRALKVHPVLWVRQGHGCRHVIAKEIVRFGTCACSVGFGVPRGIEAFLCNE